MILYADYKVIDNRAVIEGLALTYSVDEFKLLPYEFKRSYLDKMKLYKGFSIKHQWYERAAFFRDMELKISKTVIIK